ncbi:MAG TPA: type VI secretion system tube protein Hcp [Thermoanaerobaculia bacterium]
MAIYLKLGNIKGNVTTKGHEEWIEVASFQFGVTRGVNTPVGHAKNREASAPSISEVTISKEMDQSSPYLFNESTVGKGLKATFHFCRTAADKLETYLEVELENVLVSNYSVSSGGERPSESVSLNFTKVVMKYIPWKEDHAKEAPHPAGYDLLGATKV